MELVQISLHIFLSAAMVVLREGKILYVDCDISGQIFLKIFSFAVNFNGKYF